MFLTFIICYSLYAVVFVALLWVLGKVGVLGGRH